MVLPWVESKFSVRESINVRKTIFQIGCWWCGEGGDGSSCQWNFPVEAQWENQGREV